MIVFNSICGIELNGSRAETAHRLIGQLIFDNRLIIQVISQAKTLNVLV